MRARDRGESPAGRSGGVVDEACRCFGLGRGRYFACFAYRNPLFRDTVGYTLLEIGLMPIFFFVTLPRRNFLARCLEWRVWRVLRQSGQLS